MKVSFAGLTIIKEFEGCKLTSYKCPAGIWTIGYGETRGVGPGMTWTKEQAEAALIEGMVPFEKAVTEAVAPAKTTQNQFDAMVSLCYNIGAAAFKKSSVARHHKAGDIQQAANAFLLWNKAGGKVLKGLVRRREAERALYLR